MSARDRPLPRPFAGLRVGEDGVPALTPAQVRRFRTLVREQYRRAGRAFPWRTTRDPYHILVSELMLQQTQTERVAAKYPPFVERFPTLGALAAAGTRELLEAWRGLGYNRRALALRETARRILEEHGGEVPRDPEVLRGLPGIGAATASEIAAFAYDVPSPLIETNIRRVFLYFFFPDRQGVGDREILPLVERTLDRRRPRRWYYALMDYGVMLKKALPASALPDPNRRSAHYSRQSRFEGSDRQLRGAVLRVLGEHVELQEERLAGMIGEPRDRPGRGYGRKRLQGILERLAEEGFLERRAGKVRIS